MNKSPYVLTVPAINQVGTAFCIHGGPYAVDLDEFDALSQRLAAKGFVVVRVNYRGSVGFGHDWMLANRTDPGWAELEDINFVRSQLVARSALPNLPMVICGSSWGGYIALLAAGLDGNNWSGVSARSPIGDYLACYSGEHEGAREFDRFLFGGPPSELRDKYIRASPSTYCSLVTAPVQIMTGTEDRGCPVEQVRKYVRTLTECGNVPVDYQEYPMGHGTADDDLLNRQISSQVAFLEQCVMTTTGASR